MRELYLRMVLTSEQGMKDEFDVWLEGELGKGYLPFSATPPPPGAPYRASVQATGLRRLARGRAARAAIVAAVVAIGLMGTTALAAGSANPQVWGQYIGDVVTSCKSELRSGQHGIGQCVSTIARQKGAQERNQHSNGHGAGQTHPGQGGPPSAVPGGSPSGRP
jgi:hypothetical protein